MRKILLASTLILTAGVAMAQMPPSVVSDNCGASRLQNFVGIHPYAVSSDSVADTTDLQVVPGPIRVIYPDQVVINGYNATRLNVFIDSTGHILALNCG